MEKEIRQEYIKCIQTTILQNEREKTDELINAIKNNQKKVTIGNIVFDNIKSKDECIELLENMKKESENPFYLGMSAASIDEFLLKLKA